mgnify:CR=1 FL=1|tara:strand:+ start:237 stop:668 length:432 start_codon:yes stop_codon:yes gene_type:complete
MINIFTNKHIDQVLEIEKINFSHPWDTDQFYSYCMQPMKFLSYVYFKSSKVIGYLMSETIIDEVHIHNIAVEKKYQNNKVGLKLIKHLIQQSKLLNKSKICLEVSNTNISALKVYCNLGFKKVGERKGYYEDNTDAILMDLVL